MNEWPATTLIFMVCCSCATATFGPATSLPRSVWRRWCNRNRRSPPDKNKKMACAAHPPLLLLLHYCAQQRSAHASVSWPSFFLYDAFGRIYVVTLLFQLGVLVCTGACTGACIPLIWRCIVFLALFSSSAFRDVGLSFSGDGGGVGFASNSKARLKSLSSYGVFFSLFRCRQDLCRSLSLLRFRDAGLSFPGDGGGVEVASNSKARLKSLSSYGGGGGAPPLNLLLILHTVFAATILSACIHSFFPPVPLLRNVRRQLVRASLRRARE